jgi:enolase
MQIGMCSHPDGPEGFLAVRNHLMFQSNAKGGSMTNTTIQKIFCRTIYDSRGVETLEVDICTAGGGFGRAAAPFGAPGSRGEFEAPAYAAGGLTVSMEILAREIIPRLIGSDARDLGAVDDLLREIDGTANFERIGGNTSTVVSTAAAKAAADTLNMPLFRLLAGDRLDLHLPLPLGNIVGGGAHSLGPAPDMQEHLVVALGCPSLKKALAVNLAVHEEAGRLLEKKDPSFAGGTDDENAWTANLDDLQALEIIAAAAAAVGGREGLEIRMGLDLAADRFWKAEKKKYVYAREGRERTTVEQIDYLSDLIDRFRLLYVEDGFHSNDYEAFAELNRRCGDRCLICADDIYASNPERTRTGVRKKSAGAMIVKPNQVGTISGAEETARIARNGGLHVIVSHRSGETVDESIAHLAVAWGATMLKTGVKGGERLAKLNELIRIEEANASMRICPWKGPGR